MSSSKNKQIEQIGIQAGKKDAVDFLPQIFVFEGRVYRRTNKADGAPKWERARWGVSANKKLERAYIESRGLADKRSKAAKEFAYRLAKQQAVSYPTPVNPLVRSSQRVLRLYDDE